tara:strand:+ start:73 stop:333 length:261 start_codon:yes stop_codon:yes gene_type:complete
LEITKTTKEGGRRMSSDEVEWIKLGLKSKAELHEMSKEELEHYEDTLYWARAAALSMIQYLKKFGHLKLLQAPEPVTIVNDFEEEE